MQVCGGRNQERESVGRIKPWVGRAGVVVVALHTVTITIPSECEERKEGSGGGERVTGKRRRGGSVQRQVRLARCESDGEGEMDWSEGLDTRPAPAQRCTLTRSCCGLTTRAKTQGTRRDAKRRYEIGKGVGRAC